MTPPTKSSADQLILPKERVGGSEWETHPIEKPLIAQWDLRVSDPDLSKLLKGFQPQEMEDKWMSSADGPDAHGNFVVHMYRSWSGIEQVTLHGTTTINRHTRVGLEREHDTMITKIVWDGAGRPEKTTEDEAKDMAVRLCRGLLRCEFRGVS